MNSFRKLAAIISLLLCPSVFATHSPLKDPKTQAYIGHKDNIGSEDDRIITTIQDGNVTFGKDGNFTVALGVEEWGPIEVSALLTTYPDLEAGTTNASLCSILNKKEDPIVMNSQNLITQLNITASHMLVQHGIVYIFSDTDNKVHGAIFSLEKDRSAFNFTLKWELPITGVGAGGFTGANIVSDTYNSQLIVFLGGNAYYINTHFTKNDPDIVPTYVSASFDFGLWGDLRYIDAYFGTLVILSTEELALYNLTAGGMTAARFVIDGDFNMVDGVLDLRDFELNPDRTQTYNTMSSFASTKIWPYRDFFYNFSISLASHLTSLNMQRITSNLFFVADSQRVHVFDFSLLKTDVTKGKLPHPIEVSNVISVRRYKESLYLLRSASSDLNSPAVEVVEVFLLANSVNSWSDPDLSDSDLYLVNNVFLTEFNITEIFLDDVYVYMQGETKMAVAYRGKPSKYSDSQAEVFLGEPHEGIGDIGKILVDGFGIYFALLEKKPTCFNMSIAQIKVSCPVSHENANFGDYVIQFNTTTSTCPKKKSLLGSTLDVKGTLEKACLLQKNLLVNYTGVRPPRTDPAATNGSSTDTKTSPVPADGSQSIMFWFYAALAIFLVLVIAGLVYLMVKRRALRVNPSNQAHVVTNAAPGQQGVYEIRRMSATDIISPTERGTINTEAQLDPETPLKKKPPTTLIHKKSASKLE